MPRWLLRALRLGKYVKKQNPMGEWVETWQEGPFLQEVRAEMKKRLRFGARPRLKSVTMTMVITRNNGKQETIQVTNHYESNPLKRIWTAAKERWKAKRAANKGE